MKDKEKLDKLVAEIERRRNRHSKAKRIESALEDNAILSFIDSMQEEPVSGLDNGDMPIERWKQAVEAASNQRNYRSSKGLTETRDDYFVDGVQWADEHPKEEPVSEDLEKEIEMIRKYYFINDDFDKTELDGRTISNIARHFANWQKEQMIRQLENIVYRRYSLDGGSEQRNKNLIKLIQNWKCPDGV